MLLRETIRESTGDAGGGGGVPLIMVFVSPEKLLFHSKFRLISCFGIVQRYMVQCRTL